MRRRQVKARGTYPHAKGTAKVIQNDPGTWVAPVIHGFGLWNERESCGSQMCVACRWVNDSMSVARLGQISRWEKNYCAARPLVTSLRLMHRENGIFRWLLITLGNRQG